MHVCLVFFFFLVVYPFSACHLVTNRIEGEKALYLTKKGTCNHRESIYISLKGGMEGGGEGKKGVLIVG